MKLPAALALVLAAALAAAEPYAVGSVLRPFALADQHGEWGGVGEATRVLLVSADMAAGDVVKAALGDTEQRVLDERGVVYVADISGMPAVISRMFAIPKMRKRPYRVLLDRDGAVVRDLPRIEGRPTLVSLDRLRIVRIEHPASRDELKKATDSGGR